MAACGGCSNDQVPPGFELNYGKYYKLFGKDNFENAGKVCQDSGGAHLAMMKDDDDFEAVDHYFNCESGH